MTKALLNDTYMVDSAPVADMSVEKYWLRWAPNLFGEFSLCCIINENRFSSKKIARNCKRIVMQVFQRKCVPRMRQRNAY